MKNCPFCNINHCHKVYETKIEYVIYSIRPGKNKGRCCVIPKRHVSNVRQLTDEELISLFKTIKYISIKLNKYLKPEGFNYGWNEGEIAGQTIDHLHFHIIPRFLHDDLPEFHLFHRDPKMKKNLSDLELEPLIKEFRYLFNYET